ncbi:MAG: DNA-3-methyladenine glycosylase [Bacteroidales bacterium]
MNQNVNQRLGKNFFIRDVTEVAPALVGKILARNFSDGRIIRRLITEVEIYRGEEDEACHASKGMTGRTRVMYSEGGRIYVYLIYGMYWMLNFVTGPEGHPQAVLIRGIEGFNGPGKLTRALEIDGTFYGEDLTRSERIWIEENRRKFRIGKGTRIGIDYAGEEWRSKPWRYFLKNT